MGRIFLFLIFLIVMGCKNEPKEQRVHDVQQSDRISFLALGDSYTIGESVATEKRWPVQLADTLHRLGFPVQEPKIIATTGWTTADLLKALEKKTGERKYDLVSLSIGVNNQYQGRSLTEYERELEQLFQHAISLSERGPEGVFALSIPDYGVTPFGAAKADKIAEEVAVFNGVFKEVADRYDVAFYNITAVSKSAYKNPELTASDDLHPSGKMYKLWVDEILDEVVQKLKE